MRVRAPHGVPEQHPGLFEIVREDELPTDLGDGVRATDALADAPQLELRGRVCGLRHFRDSALHRRSDATFTASMIR